MKQIRFTLFIALVLLIAKPTQAQFSAGLFGDFNMANLSGNAPSETAYTGRSGVGGGVIIDYKITDEVTISLQPMFLPKGTTLSYDLPSYKEQRDSAIAKFDYFTVPLMIKVKATKVVYVTAGLDFGYLQSANIKQVNSGEINNVKEYVKSVDISANFGVGLTFEVSAFNLFVEGRYSQGLNNASAFPEGSNTDIPLEFKNTGMQILFGVLYNFGE
ncbi:MAG: PorT family protein [Chlorobi bacterium]|nr:PorT family protein [Chlorobiota bacterium]